MVNCWHVELKHHFIGIRYSFGICWYSGFKFKTLWPDFNVFRNKSCQLVELKKEFASATSLIECHHQFSRDIDPTFGNIQQHISWRRRAKPETLAFTLIYYTANVFLFSIFSKFCCLFVCLIKLPSAPLTLTISTDRLFALIGLKPFTSKIIHSHFIFRTYLIVSTLNWIGGIYNVTTTQNAKYIFANLILNSEIIFCIL